MSCMKHELIIFCHRGDDFMRKGSIGSHHSRTEQGLNVRSYSYAYNVEATDLLIINLKFHIKDLYRAHGDSVVYTTYCRWSMMGIIVNSSTIN